MNDKERVRPTLEERLEALERAYQRSEEQITTLQQQVAGYREKMREHVDDLTQVIVQLAKKITAHFDDFDARLNKQMVTLDTRFEEQAHDVHEQFRDTNMALTALTTTVGRQGQDIKMLKEAIQKLQDASMD